MLFLHKKQKNVLHCSSHLHVQLASPFSCPTFRFRAIILLKVYVCLLTWLTYSFFYTTIHSSCHIVFFFKWFFVIGSVLFVVSFLSKIQCYSFIISCMMFCCFTSSFHPCATLICYKSLVWVEYSYWFSFPFLFLSHIYTQCVIWSLFSCSGYLFYAPSSYINTHTSLTLVFCSKEGPNLGF